MTDDEREKIERITNRIDRELTEIVCKVAEIRSEINNISWHLRQQPRDAQPQPVAEKAKVEA